MYLAMVSGLEAGCKVCATSLMHLSLSGFPVHNTSCQHVRPRKADVLGNMLRSQSQLQGLRNQLDALVPVCMSCTQHIMSACPTLKS